MGCLQRCLQLITFYQNFLENRSVIWTVLGVLPNLNFLGVVLKCLEDSLRKLVMLTVFMWYCRIKGGGEF